MLNETTNVKHMKEHGTHSSGRTDFVKKQVKYLFIQLCRIKQQVPGWNDDDGTLKQINHLSQPQQTFTFWNVSLIGRCTPKLACWNPWFTLNFGYNTEWEPQMYWDAECLFDT